MNMIHSDSSWNVKARSQQVKVELKGIVFQANASSQYSTSRSI